MTWLPGKLKVRAHPFFKNKNFTCPSGFAAFWRKYKNRPESRTDAVAGKIAGHYLSFKKQETLFFFTK